MNMSAKHKARGTPPALTRKSGTPSPIRRENMKHTLLAAAAALACAIPAGQAAAQTTTVATDAAGTTVVLTTEQRSMYDAWPADRRTTYEAWPIEARRYYWTLTPEQTEGWWVLNDEQRVRIVGMTPDQRAAAWTSIRNQMSGQAATASNATSADMSANAGMSASTTSGTMQFVRRETVQPVADSGDAAAEQSGDLPVCKPNQQDGCINGWEKNRRGNKPLSYWPGKPATEIPGKKPDPN